MSMNEVSGNVVSLGRTVIGIVGLADSENGFCLECDGFNSFVDSMVSILKV